MSGGWGFGNFFGGGSSAKTKETTKNAILGLRSTMDMLTKREKHLNNEMDKQDDIARKNVTTNKTVAKAALRRKKNFERQLEQTQSQIMTLESQISDIESANINKETLDALKNASKAMKSIHGDLTIDKVDDTMEDLREQAAIGSEIATAISQANPHNAIDDDELEDALAELQQEELADKMLQSGSVPENRLATGEVANTKHRVEMDEEEELRRLQAEMAM